MNQRQSRRTLLAAMAAMGTFPHALVRAQTPVPNAGADQGGQGPRTAVPTIKPFIEIGAQVKEGETLCIIEAMKILNEIEADKSGTVTRVMAENGQAVEYGQPLFVIE